MKIEILYHTDIEPIQPLPNGDWIDLRASKDYTLYPGDFALIDLGVSIKLPDGYEAHLAPRSSTFKKWGIIQVNSVGVIDNSFAGNNDIWCMPVYATRITTICKNDRIAQFRIVPKMPPVDIVKVDSLDSPNRGGFGSTGTN